MRLAILIIIVILMIGATTFLIGVCLFRKEIPKHQSIVGSVLCSIWGILLFVSTFFLRDKMYASETIINLYRFAYLYYTLSQILIVRKIQRQRSVQNE